MPRPAKPLLIGSTESHSGKSATVLGLAFILRDHGIQVAYGKPIGTTLSDGAEGMDLDLKFIAETLNLSEDALRYPLFFLDVASIEAQLSLNGSTPPELDLSSYKKQGNEDLLLLEGPGTLDEGALFNLALPQMAEVLDASVLLVSRFHSALVVDTLLSAKQRLGNRLAGVIINDIPETGVALAQSSVMPYLERQGIPVLALLPRAPLMLSVSVAEMVNCLHAEVLCCEDRLDLMVETLSIGAMNVNSALRYFRKGSNMAVVTGGDRTDLQLAALETSTQCLVLTGHLPPSPEILARATDLEVPILSVDSDTLTTVERIDRLFGQVRLHEPVKVECIRQLMADHLDLSRLVEIFSLQLPVTSH